MYDVIIIGAGMAGMTAAIYAARAGKTVLVLENKITGGQIVNSARVDNWPGELGISGAELMDKIYHQANKFGAEFRYEVVEEVGDNRDSRDGSGRFKVKTDESEYICNDIIIATGTTPRKLSKKQMEMVGERPISYCATCDGALYEGKPVVVVGSGNTAKHEIAYLEGIASEVYQIHHDDPIPDEAEAVFVAIGRVPDTSVFVGFVEMDADGYIIASEDCRTSREGVFVAGDCRTKGVRQLVTAAADGAVAVSEMTKDVAKGENGGGKAKK